MQKKTELVNFDPSFEVPKDNILQKAWKRYLQLGSVFKTGVAVMVAAIVVGSTSAGVYLGKVFQPRFQLTDATVDGVSLHISESYLQKQLFAQAATTGFITTDPTAPVQAVTATSTDGPFKQFSVETVHYGQSDVENNISDLKPNSEPTVRADLRINDSASQAKTGAGPSADLFGSSVPSTVSLKQLQVDGGDTNVPVASVEWVKEAGGRMYVVRASQEMPSGTSSLNDSAVTDFVSQNQNLQLNSTDPSAPSPTDTEQPSTAGSGTSDSTASSSTQNGSTATDTSSSASDTSDTSANEPAPLVLPDNFDQDNQDDTSTSLLQSPFQPAVAYAATPAPAPAAASSSSSGNYSNVPWWHGKCDRKRHHGSYAIAVWRGLAACGPSIDQGGYDLNVDYGLTEWECVELTARYMFLRWNIQPYRASGGFVYDNYHGNKMVKIRNKTTGKAPHTGDVIAFGSYTGSVGHAAVVVGSNVDSHGNGKINVLQENWSIKSQTAYHLYVKKWKVQSPQSDSSLYVKGWLHYHPH